MEVQIFAIGHSITQGYWDTKGGWVQRLRTHLDEKTLENPNKFYFEVYNLGVSGDDTNQLLERIDDEIERRNSKGSKTVILIQIGANDAIYLTEKDRIRVSKQDFKKNNHKLIARAKEYADEIIFVNDGYKEIEGEIPWAEGKSYTGNKLEEYIEIQRNVCNERNVHLVDLRSKFTKEKWCELLEDGIHPNNEGHEEIYQEIKEKLEQKLF